MSANDVQVGGDHYKTMKIQPWEALEAWLSPEEFRGYLKASALAYLARAGRKGDHLEDIQKANHYLAKLIEVEGRGREQSGTIHMAADPASVGKIRDLVRRD